MNHRKHIVDPRCLVPFLFVFYIILLRIPDQTSIPMSIEVQSTEAGFAKFNSTVFNFSSLVLEIDNTPSVEAGSLTAIIPVTLTSLGVLRDALSPFFSLTGCVSRVLVLCPESLLSQSRAAVRQVMRSARENPNHPDVSLHPWGVGSDPTVAILEAAAHASTKWLLLLDDAGLSGLTNRTREMLLCPVAANQPIGPRGIVAGPGSGSCAPPSLEMRPALYLLPPFTLPSSLIRKGCEDWSDLGRAISQAQNSQIGGVIRGYGDPDTNGCNGICARDPSSPMDQLALSTPILEARLSTARAHGRFIFLLSNMGDLHLVLPVLCRLHETGHLVKILLYTSSHPASVSSSCRLHYDTLAYESNVYSGIRDWLDRLEGDHTDVIFTVSEPATHGVTSNHATMIRIPREDLEHVHWMGSLSLTEWKNWNIPRIDVSIITRDRPDSLARLMASLSQGRFFGDAVSLRLNMEQSSDLETVRIVGAYKWRHGAVFTHRRVIHGGLLPAVVESWYPHSNDSYGLLLEDDVELSPLFYAWIKMGILRYRYGQNRNETRQLFGISLYQQKNIELHPEGRKAFDPRKLFASNNFADPSTPYLSQIPCSWGAVYFPEHWREFHDYLAGRLSEATVDIGQVVVPNVRSNNWTKSWKKYFIEMVYLRGYVMLYPNYAEFTSLSTNHLEVGSHVKERPKEKREVFRLPLMPLGESQQLLDLPGGRLPDWGVLPVLNLTGGLTSLERIIEVGKGV